MTIPINSTTKTEKNKQENAPIYLYTIHNYDGSSHNLNFAEYDADIVFAGVTYSRFPIKHSNIGENSSGETDQFSVTVSNVDRMIQAYLELYDFRGKKVTVTMVWANQLADTDACITWDYYIDNYTANEDAVEFTLSSKFDVLDVQLPAGTYHRNNCRWKFKSAECGYAGAQTTCDKRKATCRDTMNNLARYGGFPSIPSVRIAV